MEIKVLEKKDEPRWEQFIKDNESSTLFHQIGWKNVIEKTYGYKSVYLFAEEDSEIVGVLPLFFIEGLIFGKRLVSIPYSPYGGCCSKNRNVTDILLAKAIEISKEFNNKYLELRNIEKINEMPTNVDNVTMLLNLTQGAKALLSNFSKNRRQELKSADKEDFNFILDSKNVRGFYSLYCRRLHELGTPVPPLSFFQNIMDNFQDTTVANMIYKGELVASQVSLHFKKTVIAGWAASLKEYWKYYTVQALYWKVIQNSINSGYELFDFGRSAENSGTYNFKKRWGAEPKTLYYQYYLNKEKEVPFIHPSNAKYKTAIKLWHFLPLPVANKLGPRVSKELI